MCEQLRCKPETLNSYLKKMDIEYAGQQNKKGQAKGGNKPYKPASYYLETGAPIKSHELKIKLLRDGVKEHKCEIYGLEKWMEYPIPLELHHKDGDHFNNTLDNLQILCPNCHALQNGNSAANIGRYTQQA